MLFGISQGSHCNIKIYRFAAINYTKVQLDDSSPHNNYEEESENVNCESHINYY